MKQRFGLEMTLLLKVEYALLFVFKGYLLNLFKKKRVIY